MRAEWRSEVEAALALVAAVVGAGFASGREVLRFFSVLGGLSWVGCLLSAALLALLCALAASLATKLGARDLGTLSKRALGGLGGRLAALFNLVMLTVTAGAMLSAMGELAALSLPVHHAYEIGIALSILLAWALAARGLPALATVGGWLLPVSLLLYALLLRQPQSAPTVHPTPAAFDFIRLVPLAFAYAAMNAALCCGVLCELGAGKSKKSIYRICFLAGAMFLILLLFANATILRQLSAVRDAALPIVLLSRSLGAVGYWLCIAVLMLAVMSTLVALLRSLSHMLAPKMTKRLSMPMAVLLPLLAASLGFESLVGSAYPLLGAGSALLFIAVLAAPKARAKGREKRAKEAKEAKDTLGGFAP